LLAKNLHILPRTPRPSPPCPEGSRPLEEVRPRFRSPAQIQNVEGGASVISIATHQLNEDIRDKELRLIGSGGELNKGGEQLGIMSADEALRIADEKGMDLVKISPQANPPVCKLMDYGKFRFEQGKREKEARKNQHVVEIKEIRMSPGIDVGDFNVKLKNAQKFLTEGNRVKVSVRFRGREMAHTDIGRKLLDKFAEQCAEIANVDKGAKLEGRNMSMFLSPKK
jgi:translation initiation factor IF-3